MAWYLISDATLITNIRGYRNAPVYIHGSQHVPPSSGAVVDCMEALVELLKAERDAGVRAVLGHFIFVFIHPYMDGNGRIGRFLMNTMLASGGFPWTVIRLEQRTQYMSALRRTYVGILDHLQNLSKVKWISP